MRISKIRNSPRILLSAAQSKSELVQDELLLTDTNNDGFSDNYIVSDYLDGELDDGGQRIFADELTKAEEFLFTPETDTVSTSIFNILEVSVNKVSGGSGRIPDMEIYGTTLVNLLGSYGNFETDSNSDGLADGWTKTVSITPTLETSDKIIGSQSQKLTLVGTATWQYIAISLTDICVEGHTYYYSQYSKRSNESDPYSGSAGFYNSGNECARSLPYPTTAWGKAKRKFIAPSFTTFTLRLYTSGYTPIVENQYVSFDGVQLIDLTAAGALDPVRQAKYGVANWEDLTEAQLEAEIPYFDSMMSVNVKDGIASELTIENRRDDPDGEAFGSIIIPATVELHGYNGVFNTIDSDGNYTKYWEREDKTTDGAGAFTLSGYASGSKVICRNKTNGEVKVLDAAPFVTTGWAVTNIEILYQLETPLSSIEVVTGAIKLYQGHNNVLSPDSSVPVAISVVNLNNDVTTSNSIVNIDNIINTASYEWNAGNLTSWSMSGRSFVNLLHDSEAVQNNYSRHFKSLEGNTYFDYLNATIITGDNTYKFVTNSSGATASMAVYNLTDLGNLTSLEADTANTLAGMALYSTATLWEDLPEAILTEMLPSYIAQYTKEYTASYIKPISNTVEHHEIPIDLPLLGLKSYNNVINSDGSGTEYAKISDLSEGSFTHLDEVDDIDYVEIELNYDLSQDLEIPEIGVCWDYSSDVSTLTRRVLDTAVEVVWDYSSDVSTLSRRAI